MSKRMPMMKPKYTECQPTYSNVSKVHRQTKNSGFSGESFHLEIIRIFDMDRSEMDGQMMGTEQPTTEWGVYVCGNGCLNGSEKGTANLHIIQQLHDGLYLCMREDKMEC